MQVELTPLFLGHASASRQVVRGLTSLEAALRNLWHAARVAWPDIDLPAAVFLPYLAERLPPKHATLVALHAVRAADLYLACACMRGHPGALAVFRNEYLSQVDRFLARKDALQGFSDEVKQVLSERLLVGTGEALPEIGGYSGRGPLAAWLRVAAVRAAIALRAVESKNVSLVKELNALAIPTAAPDPELSLLRTQCSREFREAFAAALSELTPQESSIIKLHFLEGVTAEALAALYHVSKRTLFRTIENVRRKILKSVRSHLARQLDLPKHELQSVMRAVQTDLGSTIVRFLKK